ncbi:MAG: hypothetical protein EOO38_21190 [Cytophagaceae bacterium]|nr:MAG: hypothetical protein EOO38_21190 [Cytophagaceae bacterium]
MATEKTPNYSAAQVSIMVQAARDNGGVANGDLAKVLAERGDMLDNDGKARKPRAIIAKLRLLANDKDNGFTYERQKPLTKSGKPVTNKLALVKEIVEMAGVTAAALDGLEKAPKDALETLRDAIAAMQDDEAEAA